jgi:EAL domain-containing protein (putative c-di-GMP-specific phosphodiesterase class I)
VVAVTGLAIDTHLQPIVDLRRDEAAGYEALARFWDGTPPDEVFAQARAAGSAAALEAAAVRSALGRRDDLPDGTFLSINLSPDLLDHPAVRSALQEYDGPNGLDGVVLELTEQVPIGDLTGLESSLEELRDRGALIAVDDVGAGYAGLQHLVRLRPELIKLDRDLIRGVDVDTTRLALVEALTAFAARIGSRLVAEGVETTAQLDVLRMVGVPYAQGFLWGRPSLAPAGVALAGVRSGARRATAARPSSGSPHPDAPARRPRRRPRPAVPPPGR